MANPSRAAAVRLPDVDGPTATLDEVDIRAELLSRPPRLPLYEDEDRALAVLAREMAENPRNMLQRLVEIAVDLCRADTAGISLLEGDVFRWEAVAGVFASYRNGTMPRAASPCGVCIDRDLTQLMHLPDRAFPALRTEPRFVEALLIPFHHRGKAVGTVWVVAHNDERKFDGEDERVVRVLAQFASAGWQLWRAYAAADEASRRKDEFLAMLGHELRNPLAAIVVATALLRRLGTDEKQTQVVDVLTRQGKHLSRIVDDLLDISRLTQNKLELRPELIEVKTVIGDAVDTARPQIERRHHRLSVESAPDPVWLHADPVRLVQVVANLLDNAAKFTPDGGEIALQVVAVDADVAITVRDSGRGIASEHLSTVFDLFTQPGERADRAGQGLGLGLTLVRHLTEMHGGSVEVASDGPGTGSRFTVRLPIASAPGAKAPSADPAVDVARSRRILVVEDNEDVAASLAMTLAHDGHTVRTVHDGSAALEAVQTFAPEVVLLDVGLPGMSGYDVARRLRETESGAPLAIIAVSGYGGGKERTLSRLAGCDAHLVKPVDPDALRAALRSRTAR
jgi:signal transduction histidine kinase